MPTEFDATAYAARLGVTREDWPEYYESKCSFCGQWDSNCSTACNISNEGCRFSHDTAEHRCTLPSPYSDDPRACAWEPFLMRALEQGYYLVNKGRDHNGADGWEVRGPWYFRLELQERFKTTPTPTSALAAAFDAKEVPNG